MIDLQSVLIFLKFSISGICGVSINFSLTYFLKEKLHLNKYFSSSIALSIALITNYILNRIWTFQLYYEPIYYQFFKFLLVIIVSVFLNHMIVYLFHKYLKINFYYSKLIAVLLVFFWNFIMHSFFTFSPI